MDVLTLGESNLNFMNFFKDQPRLCLISQTDDQNFLFLNLQINFPAITVCPRLLPNVGMERRPGLGYKTIYRHDKHTLRKSFYEIEEVRAEFLNEYKIENTRYVNILDRIENRSIKAEELGIKL